MWTRLSSLVPDLIIVFFIVPLSIQQFAPISTSLPISTAPIDATLTNFLDKESSCVNLSMILSSFWGWNENPSEPITTFWWHINLSPIIVLS